jgi:CheY-like chemotaxis protein
MRPIGIEVLMEMPRYQKRQDIVASKYQAVNLNNILLVEDDLANQFGIMTLLKQSGHKVALANNGKEALCLMIESNFDLILMSCSMPLMDGYQVTSIIRGRPSEARSYGVPIIGLSCDSTQEGINKSVSVGMNDYMLKPFIFADLLTMIDKWTAAIV